MSRAIVSKGVERGLPAAMVLGGLAGVRPRLYLGRASGMIQQILEEPPTISLPPVFRMVFLAHRGQDVEDTEVVQTLDQLVINRPKLGSATDETPAWNDILLLEVAVLVGHQRVAELLLSRLDKCKILTTESSFITCTGRHLGGAATLLGRPIKARAHYQRALEFANQMAFRPEVALIRLQIAELLIEYYPSNYPEALEHLEFAINEFRDMNMRPSLERANRHKYILSI